MQQTIYTPTGSKQKVSEFETTPAHYTIFAGFDAFDHVTKITAPDNHVTTMSYGSDPMSPGARLRSQTRSIATGATETSQTRTEIYDALGRLQQVIEPAGGTQTSTYKYEVGGHLSTVTMFDGQHYQTRSFSFDGRGLLLSEQHPENATITYGNYDARAHVGSKTASDPVGDCNYQTYRCFDLKYTYDHAERLTQIQSRNPLNPGSFRPLKTFSYATANDGINKKQGKLEIATRHNYHPNLGDIIVTETYGYNDDAGRLTETG